jgi:hypothetical protein
MHVTVNNFGKTLLGRNLLNIYLSKKKERDNVSDVAAESSNESSSDALDLVPQTGEISYLF